MANITEIKDTDRLIDSVETLNDNFSALNTGKSDTGHTHDDRYYTESETNALLNNKANSSDLDNYLLKSGGTVSGTLTIGNSISFNSATSELNKNANNGYLLLRGGTTYNDSANLLLYGNDRTENAGRAILRAGNGSTQIYVDSNGTFAPTPATTDNSNKIATTAYVQNNISAIGTMARVGSQTTTLTTGQKSICSLSLGAGTWIIVGKVDFSDVSLNVRHHIQIATSPDTTAHADEFNVNGYCTSNDKFLDLQVVAPWSFTTTTTVYLNIYAAGGTPTVFGIMRAIRIK